jgi:hypothetical protein
MKIKNLFLAGILLLAAAALTACGDRYLPRPQGASFSLLKKEFD